MKTYSYEATPNTVIFTRDLSRILHQNEFLNPKTSRGSSKGQSPHWSDQIILNSQKIFNKRERDREKGRERDRERICNLRLILAISGM